MQLVFCDTNRILCEALAAALEARGHEVVAIATTSDEGVVATAEHRPDICILDLCLPSPDEGIEVVRAIGSHCPATKVLVLSGLADPAAGSEVRGIGVAGILRKNQNVDQISDALDVIARGGRVFDPGFSPQPRPRSADSRRNYPLYFLTDREKEVLRRLASGQSTGQMAREMNIAISTLRTYVKNVLCKLGAHSRLEAAAVASREGLVGGVPAA
jgi:two-component system, NarL family, nitrate/nitrite response regulator NarL